MHTSRWIPVGALCLLLAAASLAAGSRAQAQTSASQKAAAEALFDRGMSLMREGKLPEACARLEQSQAIERGIGTMLYLAECYERLGRTASAWALFREASSEAQAAGQVERALAGKARAERLEPQLAKLIIEVPAEARLSDLEVLRNGMPIPSSVWGIPLPVDPGTQEIEARAPGYVSWTGQVTVDAGPSEASLTVQPLAVAPNPVARELQTSVPSVATPPPASVPPPLSDEQRARKWKRAGMIFGGTGAALLVVGAAMGGRAIKQNNEAKGDCAGSTCSTPEAADANDAALTASRVSTGTLISGAALIAGGALMYFLAPRETNTRLSFGADAHGASLGVGGVF